MNSGKRLIIGTRGSPLALAQAGEVKSRLLAAHGDLSDDDLTIRVIRTSGDRILDRPLVHLGGKGLFTKEIEEALAAGAIDLAVHSGKDVPAMRPPGLTLGVWLAREDPRDVLISPLAARLEDLPEGARLGTASPRRRAQALARRPDLIPVLMRGNVGTRLDKLEAGEVDVTILALAGLKRLDRLDAVTAILSLEEALPAPAQGALALDIRVDDGRVTDLVAPLNHPHTACAVAAERAALLAIDGSCRTPLGAYGEINADQVTLRVGIWSLDGTRHISREGTAPVADAVTLGTRLGDAIRREAGPDFFTALNDGVTS